MVTFKKFEHNEISPKFGKSDLLKCSPLSLEGVKTPMYFLGSQSPLDDAALWGLGIPVEEQSLLDALFLSQWEDQMSKGHFRYDVTTTEIKVISGRGKFVAQLNDGWNMDYLSKAGENKVCESVDPFVFRCMNQNEELLFGVASNMKENSELIARALVPNDSILVMLNAIPAEYGHVFLVPSGTHRLNQLDAVSLEMIMRISAETNNPSFRVFYDFCSPGASHVYFQACYFSDNLPVELMPVCTFFADEQMGTRLSTVMDHPINVILLECPSNIKLMAEVMSQTCSYLQSSNIPYNILISNCGKKIFLFLQKMAKTSCNHLSAWECSGYFLFRSRNEYDRVTEDAIREQLSAISLDDENLQAVKQQCCSIASKLGN